MKYTCTEYRTEMILLGLKRRLSQDDLSVRICTAEDLIIQKAITGRSKDWLDIEGVIIEQNEKLDRQYVKYWLEQFSEALGQPEILFQYNQLWNEFET